MSYYTYQRPQIKGMGERFAAWIVTGLNSVPVRRITSRSVRAATNPQGQANCRIGVTFGCSRWSRRESSRTPLWDEQCPCKQCFGSGSGRIRIIGQDSDPDPYQETLIWIRVPKKNRDKLAYKSTKIIKNNFFIKEITYFV